MQVREACVAALQEHILASSSADKPPRPVGSPVEPRPVTTRHFEVAFTKVFPSVSTKVCMCSFLTSAISESLTADWITLGFAVLILKVSSGFCLVMFFCGFLGNFSLCSDILSQAPQQLHNDLAHLRIQINLTLFSVHLGKS